MSIYELPHTMRWYYHHPKIGFSGNVAAGPTRSEARSAIKRALKLPRVPVGTRIVLIASVRDEGEKCADGA